MNDKPLSLFWQECVTSLSSAIAGDTICLDQTEVPEKWQYPPAVLFVSLQMRNKLARAGIHPIIIDSPWHLEPALLMAHCPQRMLSDDMILLPFGNLAKRKSVKSRFFIRPNSGSKSFPGQVINSDEIGTLKQSYLISDETLVCIASERKVLAEKRCIIDTTTGQIISQSPYAHDGQEAKDFEVDAKRDWTGLVPFGLLPEIIVADFALTPDGVRLIELNSISTSGLYDIKPEEIYNYINSNQDRFS